MNIRVWEVSVAMDHICHQLIGQKFCTGQHYTKICKDLGVSRSLVFMVIKLLDEGRDLTLQPRGRKEAVDPDCCCHHHVGGRG
jgi:hypothetical protein